MHYPSAPVFDLNRSYFSLSPSVHFSYSTKNMHNFTLSYTRRVSNPEGSQLTHFKVLADDSFSTGSPDLRQSFTHNMEAGWQKFFELFGNLGMSVSTAFSIFVKQALRVRGIPFAIIFTKTDKPKQRELTQNVNTFLIDI